MDEITMLRNLTADPPPPGPATLARAERLLDQRIRGRRMRPRRSHLTGPVAIGAVAFSAAGALAAVILSSGGLPAQHAQGPGPTSPRSAVAGHSGALAGRSAHAFLLAVAIKAQNAGTVGRYWCSMTVTGTREAVGAHATILGTVGNQHNPASVPAGTRYWIVERYASGSCLENPRTGWPGGTAGGFFQELGARPASPADTRAWRSAGSPSRWRNGRGTHGYSTHAGPRLRTGVKTGMPSFGNSASLPSSLAKASELLLRDDVPGPHSTSYKAVRMLDGESYREFQLAQQFQNVTEAMADGVSPAARATLFRVFARIQGVQMKSGVRIPEEQQAGTAVWLDYHGSIDSSILVVDPRTGILLGDLSLSQSRVDGLPAGTVLSYDAIRSWWTNRLPYPPRTPYRPAG